jgi:hypothetical protein
MNKPTKLLALLLALLMALSPLSTVTAAAAPAVVTITANVMSDSDDMEEWMSDGQLDYNSSDLELGLEKPGTGDGTPQYVGIRFDGLAIPQGAQIVSAYMSRGTR